MNSFRYTIYLILLVWLAATPVTALTTEQNELIYKSVFPQAPLSRVGSTQRSSFERSGIIVFAPQRKGVAANSQPTFFWCLSQPTDKAIEFVLQEFDASEPLLEVTLSAGNDVGVESLSLKDYAVKLKPGKEYEWSVAVVIDPDRRSHDSFSMGIIQYLEPTTTFKDHLARLATEKRVQLLAGAGYWYDALALLERQIEETAGNKSLIHRRNELLNSQQIAIDILNAEP